jgi:hypothetical protein
MTLKSLDLKADLMSTDLESTAGGSLVSNPSTSNFSVDPEETTSKPDPLQMDLQGPQESARVERSDTEAEEKFSVIRKILYEPEVAATRALLTGMVCEMCVT